MAFKAVGLSVTKSNALEEVLLEEDFYSRHKNIVFFVAVVQRPPLKMNTFRGKSSLTLKPISDHISDQKEHL